MTLTLHGTNTTYNYSDMGLAAGALALGATCVYKGIMDCKKGNLASKVTGSAKIALGAVAFYASYLCATQSILTWDKYCTPPTTICSHSASIGADLCQQLSEYCKTVLRV